MAERVGFEPTRRLPAYGISNAAPSAGLGDLSAVATHDRSPSADRQRDLRSAVRDAPYTDFRRLGISLSMDAIDGQRSVLWSITGLGGRGMEFHFGARVLGIDDIGLGELTRVVYDPETWEIDVLIAQSVRMGERELQVPLAVVESTEDETVQLSLSEHEFEDLDVYSWSHNVAPPPDRDFADVDEEDELTPGSESPPIGAATGIETIAFTPIIEEEVFIPSGDGVIDRSTEVWATDGLVGNVRTVNLDDQTGRISRVLVRHGTIFTHEIVVPVEYVETMRTDTIVLSVDRAAVDAEHSS
jgi:sporulation protein YlmC with PRC-barrel domain